jgi:hypothetical protein
MTRDSGERRVTDRLAAELACRRLSDQNGAGGLGALNGWCVDRRNVVRHRLRPRRVKLTGHRHQVFGRKRQAVQQPERLPAHDRVFRFSGGLERGIGHQEIEAV